MTKEDLRKKFQFELEKLSVRAKNVLEDQGIFLFDFFYDQYFIQQSKIEFIRCRNCGAKTKIELDQFILEMCKNMDLELPVYPRNILKPQLLQNNPKIPLKYDFKTKLIFESEYDNLNVRTKNVLSNLDSDSIDGFYYNAFIKDDNSILSVRNCGAETLEEIYNFKLKFKEILDKSSNQVLDLNSFSDLNFYINYSECFNSIEFELFQYYYGFIICEKKFTIEEIAKKNGYSKERIRQISKSLLKHIREIIIRLTNNYNLDFRKYFIEDCFIVDQNFSKKINQRENTNFSHKLVSLVLTSTNNPEFEFLHLGQDKLTNDILFYQTSLSIDCMKCFRHLKELVFYKKEHCKIHIDDLIHSFSKVASFGSVERSKKINIIQIIMGLFNKEEELIKIVDDFVFIRRDSRPHIYELIVEILDYFKKPMHFSDIYQEGITRGYDFKTPTSVHSTLGRYNDIFGLKGPGIYGLLEWGGYFGTIGDVAAEILEKRSKPIPRRELEDLLCRELYISKDSISVVLFGYELETRFIKTRNDSISLKKWAL